MSPSVTPPTDNADEAPKSSVKGSRGGANATQRAKFNWHFIEEKAAVIACFAAAERIPDQDSAEFLERCADNYIAQVNNMQAEWIATMAAHGRNKNKKSLHPTIDMSLEHRCRVGGKKQPRGHYIADRYKAILKDVVKLILPIFDQDDMVNDEGKLIEGGGGDSEVASGGQWYEVLQRTKMSFYNSGCKTSGEPKRPPDDWESAVWWAFDTYGPHKTGKDAKTQFTIVANGRCDTLGGSPGSGTPKVNSSGRSAQRVAIKLERKGKLQDAGAYSHEATMQTMTLKQAEAADLQAQQVLIMKGLAERRDSELRITSAKAQMEALNPLIQFARDTGDEDTLAGLMADYKAQYAAMKEAAADANAQVLARAGAQAELEAKQTAAKQAAKRKSTEPIEIPDSPPPEKQPRRILASSSQPADDEEPGDDGLTDRQRECKKLFESNDAGYSSTEVRMDSI